MGHHHDRDWSPYPTTNDADEIGLYAADVSGTITSDGADSTGVKVLAFYGATDGGDILAWAVRSIWEHTSREPIIEVV